MDQKIINYLDSRGVNDVAYRNFMNFSAGKQHFELCSVNDFDFMVSHFLDTSDQMGYGLLVTNEVLKTNTGDKMAIGLIEGDDIICMDIPTGKIQLWMIQTGNGESLEVADSFDRFFKMCCPSNE